MDSQKDNALFILYIYWNGLTKRQCFIYLLGFIKTKQINLYWSTELTQSLQNQSLLQRHQNIGLLLRSSERDRKISFLCMFMVYWELLLFTHIFVIEKSVCVALHSSFQITNIFLCQTAHSSEHFLFNSGFLVTCTCPLLQVCSASSVLKIKMNVHHCMFRKSVWPWSLLNSLPNLFLALIQLHHSSSAAQQSFVMHERGHGYNVWLCYVDGLRRKGICTHTSIYTPTHICARTHTHMHTHAYIHSHTHVHTHMHTHTHTESVSSIIEERVGDPWLRMKKESRFTL